MKIRLGFLTPAVFSLVMFGAASCGDDGGDDDGAGGGGGGAGGATHAQALSVIQRGTCASSVCHSSPTIAMLDFKDVTDLRTVLVGKTACEAPDFDLVEPGNPEKSWLYIKLTGKTEGSAGNLVPQKEWGESAPCPGASGFGKRMPAVSPYMLNAADVEIIRSWIKGGAPGPV